MLTWKHYLETSENLLAKTIVPWTENQRSSKAYVPSKLYISHKTVKFTQEPYTVYGIQHSILHQNRILSGQDRKISVKFVNFQDCILEHLESRVQSYIQVSKLC